MIIQKLSLLNFRNAKRYEVCPHNQLNIFIGENGSGKSSLVESLYYLGYGRSFRTSKHDSMIRHESDCFSIFCQCVSGDDIGVIPTSSAQLKLGVERARSGSIRISVNGEKTSKLSQLVRHIPIQLFTPQSTDLILGTPSERRRFCDWGLFHVEHEGFFKNHATYQRALKQRNAILKSIAKAGGLKRYNAQTYSSVTESDRITSPTASRNTDSWKAELKFWDQQIAQYGEVISDAREAYCGKLAAQFNINLSTFLPEFPIEISYHRGWEKSTTLAESIATKIEADLRYGFTSSGPHKADLRFTINKIPVQEVLSRGQLRMMIAALLLSQSQVYKAETSRTSIFLLDDIGAELDADKRSLFIDALVAQKTQLFITAIEVGQLEFLEKYNDKKVFHVEHGHVTEELN